MADDAPPPAYDENATEADDGKADTATTTQPKPKREDKPPEEGEGALGSPLQRAMFFAAVVALYAVLAIYMPAYWMAGAVNPCKFACNTYPAAYGGCYGLTSLNTTSSSDCKDICHDDCEAAYDVDALRDLSYENYANSYMADPDNGRAFRLSAWTLVTIGIGFGGIGAILAYFGQKKGKRTFQMISSVLMGLGGVMLIVGGLLFTISFSDESTVYQSSVGDYLEEIFNAIRSAIFLEFAFPGFVMIMFAADVSKLVLNPENKRLLWLSIPIIIFGLYGGVIFAYIINWEPDPSTGYDFELYDALACCSAGYFIMALVVIFRLLVDKDKISLGDNPANAVMYKFMMAIFMIIGGFICAVGYWAFIDGIFDCDTDLFGSTSCDKVGYLIPMYGDIVGPNTLALDIDDVNYESQFKAYYCGYSFFIIGISIIVSLDMGLVDNYKKVRAAQQAAETAT